MFTKFTALVAAFGLIATIGMTAFANDANAAPSCYKTGRNTVQCIGK